MFVSFSRSYKDSDWLIRDHVETGQSERFVDLGRYAKYPQEHEA